MKNLLPAVLVPTAVTVATVPAASFAQSPPTGTRANYIVLKGGFYSPNEVFDSIIEPYGEFGVGGYIADVDVSGSACDFGGSTRGAFGVHAGAGVNVNITPSVFLGAEGRYLWAKPSRGGDDIKLDGFIVTGNLGYRF